MTTTSYAYSGNIVIDRKLFDQWVLTMLPIGPFYAVGIPEWLDLQTMKVPYNASTSGPPDRPVQIELFPTE